MQVICIVSLASTTLSTEALLATFDVHNAIRLRHRVPACTHAVVGPSRVDHVHVVDLPYSTISQSTLASCSMDLLQISTIGPISGSGRETFFARISQERELRIGESET